MTKQHTVSTRRQDYRPPAWLVEQTCLEFTLDPQETRVVTEIHFKQNPRCADIEDLVLDGRDLRLTRASIDGCAISKSILEQADNGLVLPKQILPGAKFCWRAETQISPQSNTSLDGLYMSNGMYCTQCEPEGFRRICHFPDRPDILSRFTVRINGKQPALLSNGNLVERGQDFAVWHDPWPKPSYLFALVAGDLVSVDDSFTTASGRHVDLHIWVRKGDEGRCDYAMDSLKRAMAWDEQTYGREYDLDQFNIVAVDDFNMGAMENKGLNIFNSKLVLASPETATDDDYESIESVIAHEYFHNWTGNRVTCRDWFQLSLKEGLTVHRDRQFSGDQRSAAVVRIKNVCRLRDAQFREDAGPLAHPVRPDSYREISNFYTHTIYEKGAELVSMLCGLAGADGYRKAVDLYFDRHDGEACTIEDWLAAFEDSLQMDLSQFKQWYCQAGTPHLSYKSAYQNGELLLTLEQRTAPTPGQPEKSPLPIPVAVGLIGDDGHEIGSTRMLLLTRARETFGFTDLPHKPKISVLRGFSAPVIITTEPSVSDASFALRFDSDPFNRWDSGQFLMRHSLSQMILHGKAPDSEVISSLVAAVNDSSLDPELRAILLKFPPEDELRRQLAQRGHILDPDDFYRCQEELTREIAAAMSAFLPKIVQELSDQSPYTPSAKDAGRRSLRLGLLRLLCQVDGGEEAARQYHSADNMTVKLAALRALLSLSKGESQLHDFFELWSHDRLVLDKWFAVQILESRPVDAPALTRSLTTHPNFEWQNPNRFRAVIGTFAFRNTAGFHKSNGEGYALLADWLIKLDAANPQVAARHCTAFESWKQYDSSRQMLMHREMERIRSQAGLSADSLEMLDRLLGDAGSQQQHGKNEDDKTGASSE
ncbi:MAG: aminopeptidase N [Rhodobacteraceae bacterium]|nr:aminopeptidase N [Paracoccaceae bacterium]